MRFLFLALLPLLLISPLMAEVAVPSVHLFFPQFVVGDGWECDLTLVAQGAERSTGLILFYNQAGDDLRLNVNGTETIVPAYDLPSGTATTYHITKEGPLEVGFVLVSQGASVQSRQGSIGGILTYRYRVGGETRTQLGVPASRSLFNSHIPYDNQGGNRTALAILSTARVPVTLIRRNESGMVQGSTTIDFQDFSQTAQFVDEVFPSSAGSRGFLEASSADAFQILILNQNGSLLSTSASLPGMLERDLTIQTPGETTEWTLRLVQEGYFLYGLTTLKTQPGEPDYYTLITGIRLGPILQLNLLDLQGNPGNLCLLASTGDLEQVEGSVTVVENDGTVSETGTFELSRRSQAPF